MINKDELLKLIEKLEKDRDRLEKLVGQQIDLLNNTTDLLLCAGYIKTLKEVIEYAEVRKWLG